VCENRAAFELQLCRSQVFALARMCDIVINLDTSSDDSDSDDDLSPGPSKRYKATAGAAVYKTISGPRYGNSFAKFQEMHTNFVALFIRGTLVVATWERQMWKDTLVRKCTKGMLNLHILRESYNLSQYLIQ